MRGASRWLDARAAGTAGKRRSAPRPSAAHAPMTDRDGALPFAFMCPSFSTTYRYGRGHRNGSRRPLPAPFAPPPAHQYPPGTDDRGRCSVKTRAIILAAALAVTTARCGQGGKETAPAPSERPAVRSVRITMAALHQAGGVPSGWRFTPPAGDVEAVLTPDAVLVEGPDYIGPDGHSAMPSYPDLTLRQLGDLVAYLKSLRAG